MKLQRKHYYLLAAGTLILCLLFGWYHAERKAADKKAAAKAAIERTIAEAAAKAALEKAAIERVLAEDKALAKKMGEEADFFDKNWDGSAMVAKYAADINSIDLKDCPIEFKHAFKTHVSAWGNIATVKGNAEGINGFVKNFITLGYASLSDYEKMEKAQAELKQSWDAVQKIAIDHGVDP